jgi:hypothetical protein
LSERERARRAMKMDNHYSFYGGHYGAWRVISQRAVKGEALALAPRIDVTCGETLAMTALPPGCAWRLRGLTSHVRYAERAEVELLAAKQPPTGRLEATCAALIPIRKNAAWWALAQDERRQIFEAASHHTQLGLDALPAVARRLHHSRDLGEAFDFVTWFEYAPEHAVAFEKLVYQLRATPEWDFVEREIDIRLVREAA